MLSNENSCLHIIHFSDIRIKETNVMKFTEKCKKIPLIQSFTCKWYFTHILFCFMFHVCLDVPYWLFELLIYSLNQICGLCMFLPCFYYIHLVIYLCSLPANRVIVRKLKIELTYFWKLLFMCCNVIRRTILLEVNEIMFRSDTDTEDNVLKLMQ